MKKSLLALCAVLCVGAASASPFSVTVRGTYLQTVDRSDAFSALGLSFAKNSISVSDKLIPEIDLNYAFTDTVSAQLVLTVPQTHHVDLAGVGRLGSFKHLPPTLFVQYSPFPNQRFRPYVSAGVNYTLIFDTDLSVANVPLGLDNASIGLAGQTGFNYVIDQSWSLNVDVKKAMIRSDVTAGGAKLSEARLDPWLYSLGVNYTF